MKKILIGLVAFLLFGLLLLFIAVNTGFQYIKKILKKG